MSTAAIKYSVSEMDIRIQIRAMNAYALSRLQAQQIVKIFFLPIRTVGELSL